MAVGSGTDGAAAASAKIGTGDTGGGVGGGTRAASANVDGWITVTIAYEQYVETNNPLSNQESARCGIPLLLLTAALLMTSSHSEGTTAPLPSRDE